MFFKSRCIFPNHHLGYLCEISGRGSSYCVTNFPMTSSEWATHLKKYATVKLDSTSPNSRVENKQYLSCHHPRYVHGVNPHEKMCCNRCNRCNPWKFILKQHYLNPSKQHEIRWTCKVFKELASEPRKKTSCLPLYCLFNRDPYNSLWQSQ